MASWLVALNWLFKTCFNRYDNGDYMVFLQKNITLHFRPVFYYYFKLFSTRAMPGDPVINLLGRILLLEKQLRN